MDIGDDLLLSYEEVSGLVFLPVPDSNVDPPCCPKGVTPKA